MTLSTRRLYREDPYCAHFAAHVLQTCEHESRPAVILDATCFYPTSGGQPHDTGALEGVPVVDVLEQGEAIVHVLAAPLAADLVHGEIDWPRRFDHMQQHTGQHLLSQAFVRELGGATVSFHLGEEACTIDVALATLDWAQVERVEQAANAAVFANQPVSTREYRPDEQVEEALRKLPTTEGALRVVRIGDYDASACCGTHVRATGEVGPIHIRRWERRKGDVRVEFLCGWRALRSQRQQNRICQDLAVGHSVAVADLPELLQRLEREAEAAGKQAQALRKRLLEAGLPHLAAQAEVCGSLHLLCRLLEGYDAANMRTLAQAFTREPARVALLAVTEPAPQVCYARSADVALDMAALLRATTAACGGKGGGSPQLAQGGGMAATDLEQVLQAAREQVCARHRREPC